MSLFKFPQLPLSGSQRENLRRHHRSIIDRSRQPEAVNVIGRMFVIRPIGTAVTVSAHPKFKELNADENNIVAGGEAQSAPCLLFCIRFCPALH